MDLVPRQTYIPTTVYSVLKLQHTCIYIQLNAIHCLHSLNNSLWFAIKQSRFVKKYMNICNNLSNIYNICVDLVNM